MTRLAAFLVALLLGACSAHAQIPLLRGPYDPGTTQGTFNTLIQQINNITGILSTSGMPNSVLGSSGSGITLGTAGAANNIVIAGGATGVMPTITAFGTDADVSLHLLTQGKGVVSLLYGSQFGFLKFANANSWVPATGLAVCPAYNGLPMGAHPSIQGYIAVKDYEGNVRYLPAC